ncbi:flagellar transcriptional regulator FlhC [Aromatoleum evansii]|uniref:Flagellar transcriptional regulator FlhC n=1 Tax=Aromatoleum evansii TaxID=59406 RepID=A0ABZ1ANN3_AROEV|nr:flagellar transcriptional regulator FlhC [Aromatoleum evansii]NMG27314.1 flagellar transcriptional regulator FlhC [Aromatoleum evansii]WRL47475.1 flagellar transcriptional regulator FlhC [Aromatoleum evansii]
MKNKSIIEEAEDIQRAAEMVRLGARMQMLEAETKLSRERLLKIYKEIRGMSPPKGMLPFSTDWFMTWQPNVHASLFMNFFRFFQDNTGLKGLDAILKAYHLYLDHIEAEVIEPALSLTRAWTLVRFFDADLLQMASCTSCGGHFVAHAYDPTHEFVCGLCNMPSRAGKTKRAAEAARATGTKRATATRRVAKTKALATAD